MKKGPKIKIISIPNNPANYQYQNKFLETAQKLFNEATHVPAIPGNEAYKRLYNKFQSCLKSTSQTKQMLRHMLEIIRNNVQDTQILMSGVQTYQKMKETILSINKRLNVIHYLLDQVIPQDQGIDDTSAQLHNALWEDLALSYRYIKSILAQNIAPIGENNFYVELEKQYRLVMMHHSPCYVAFLENVLQGKSVALSDNCLKAVKYKLDKSFVNFINIEVDSSYINTMCGDQDASQRAYASVIKRIKDLRDNTSYIVKVTPREQTDIEKNLDEAQSKVDVLTNHTLDITEQTLRTMYQIGNISITKMILALSKLTSAVQSQDSQVELQPIIQEISTLTEKTGLYKIEDLNIMSFKIDFNNLWEYVLRLEDVSPLQAIELLLPVNKALLSWKNLFAQLAKNNVVAKLLYESLEGIVTQSIETRLKLQALQKTQETKSKEALPSMPPENLQVADSVVKADKKLPEEPVKDLNADLPKNKEPTPKETAKTSASIVKQPTKASVKTPVKNANKKNKGQRQVPNNQVKARPDKKAHIVSPSTQSKVSTNKAEIQASDEAIERTIELFSDLKLTSDIKDQVKNIPVNESHVEEISDPIIGAIEQLSGLTLESSPLESIEEISTKDISEASTQSLTSDLSESKESTEKSIDVYSSIGPTEFTIPIPVEAKEFLTLLNKKGYWAFTVGGYVRDNLLGIPSNDVDIITNCPKSRLAEMLETPCVENKFIKGLFNVKGMDILCSELSLENELKRRDITINALIADREGKVYDVLGNIADLANPNLVMIGDINQRLAEDPSRILRMVRYSNHVRKGIPENYVQALHNNASIIIDIPFGLYLKNIAALFLRGNAMSNINGLLYLNLYHYIYPYGGISTEFFPWINFFGFMNNKMLEIDVSQPTLRDELYSPYSILALFLLPEFFQRLGTHGMFELAEEEVVEAFCKNYKGEFSTIEKNVFDKAVKSMFAKLYEGFNQYNIVCLKMAHKHADEQQRRKLLASDPKEKNAAIPNSKGKQEVSPKPIVHKFNQSRSQNNSNWNRSQKKATFGDFITKPTQDDAKPRMTTKTSK